MNVKRLSESNKGRGRERKYKEEWRRMFGGKRKEQDIRGKNKQQQQQKISQSYESQK